ncbi:MAG: type II toxin-antitoxin system VapC family toxin [Balneolaceae bacterium]|nr:type II toxin-antitoxin system VapC family toxin [Balneolaceae bacterium]
MAQPIIIDTDILIDFSLDRSDAVNTMANLEDQFTLNVSVITAMELYAGCRSKKDLYKVDDLISGIHIEFVTRPISKQALELMKEFRSSHGVEINDMLIAATSLNMQAKMISKNQKHYKFLPEIDLLEYPLNRV